jgi:hypothetical protein
VIVLFAEGVPEISAGLPREARGYRYFVAGRFLFYYSVAATEIRVTAIIPASMRRA